ncbi:MAG TPA: hypothetical protein VK393_09895 [Nocardioidaceae bacterium]|jgi:hypothetical protein|nr:hypothetical protein [Nocardioidaceae bacterium]
MSGSNAGPAQVQSADQGIKAGHIRQTVNVLDDVDCAGVTTAGQHDQALLAVPPGG